MTDAPAPQPSAANARRRVPRWVWFVVVCVALGAMTSVGVAWGIAWKPALSKWPVEHPQGQREPWLHNSVTLIGREEHIFFAKLESGTLKTLEHTDVTLSAHALHNRTRTALQRHARQLCTLDAENVEFMVVVTGWPWRSLAMEFPCTAADVLAMRTPRSEWNAKSNQWEKVPVAPTPVDDAFSLPPHIDAIKVGSHFLPTFPLWPGLLANTAIYGGAWAVLIGAPILLRRWLRARRGGCPQCGYSREGLKVDAPCPECGRTPPAAHDATPTPASR